MEWVLLIVLLACGYIVGLMQNGIKVTVNHNHYHTNVPVEDPHSNPEYNESTEDMLPEEVTTYMKKNNGFMNF